MLKEVLVRFLSLFYAVVLVAQQSLPSAPAPQSARFNGRRAGVPQTQRSSSLTVGSRMKPANRGFGMTAGVVEGV